MGGGARLQLLGQIQACPGQHRAAPGWSVQPGSEPPLEVLQIHVDPLGMLLHYLE